MDIRTVPLGQEFTQTELNKQCRVIYAGVSWPAKKPGFAVVLGLSREQHFDNFDIVLIDEYESEDVRELVRQCGVLDYKYEPKLWYGDTRNDAADRFIREMNSEMNEGDGRRNFYVRSTPILDMTFPYHYILAELRQLLNKDRRQLFLKDSKILDYLTAIDGAEISELVLGDFPAIEALGFAVIELRRHGSLLAQRKRPDRWDPKPPRRTAMAG